MVLEEVKKKREKLKKEMEKIDKLLEKSEELKSLERKLHETVNEIKTLSEGVIEEDSRKEMMKSILQPLKSLLEKEGILEKKCME